MEKWSVWTIHNLRLHLGPLRLEQNSPYESNGNELHQRYSNHALYGERFHSDIFKRMGGHLMDIYLVVLGPSHHETYALAALRVPKVNEFILLPSNDGNPLVFRVARISHGLTKDFDAFFLKPIVFAEQVHTDMESESVYDFYNTKLHEQNF
jgi:hypothetical protein